MSKKAFILVITVGLISVILGATIAWFHDTGSSRNNVFTAGTWTHDIAVVNIHPSKNIVGQGYNMCISVTITNEGTLPETFNVTAYANTTLVETQKLNLAPGNFITITFTWNTTSFAYDWYVISAVADAVPGETDTTDNTHINGMVFVTIAGDIWGDPDDPDPSIPDGDVDWFDFGIFALNYGKTI